MIRQMRERLRQRKGFTLAELLIVVAIIAVLVAIAIPTFTNQLEKAREATDAANIRALYAEVVAEYLETGNPVAAKTMPVQQKKDGWQSDIAWPSGITAPGAKTSGSWSVSCGADGEVSIN
ncbi:MULTISPECIES: competence type IV pilus major pilin ComGC [unclassified Butyrivibrio]|uniref:competence type IV pilus major pilin ComGC n=1 Tax=unclassified Butyrivibrio TaxID=2639466 RepID=UPI0003B35268|nr:MULTISPECIES: prepilin-type N-terminal cleavage/methylation domain-containing protein [unclassified Butyrivibrio]SEK92323.1 prepilin-type N-terminal cleavage/methylation domain-containing protein [Butyrivibrio sp. ob235]